ncbi:MAG TPA: hypothetical protein VIM84_05100, partial [Gemmatimonadales bacterium]
MHAGDPDELVHADAVGSRELLHHPTQERGWKIERVEAELVAERSPSRPQGEVRGITLVTED